MPPENSWYSSQLKELEGKITVAISENVSLNPLVDFLDLMSRARNAAETSTAIYALYRTFVTILRSGKMDFQTRVDPEGKIVRDWLMKRLNHYTDVLVGLLRVEEKTLRISALKILFSLQKHLSALFPMPSQLAFHISHFRKIVIALLVPPHPPSELLQWGQVIDGVEPAPDVRDTFVETWLNVYDDVRWFFLREASSILSTTDGKMTAVNLLSILERLTKFPSSASDLKTWWVEELGVKPGSSRNTVHESLHYIGSHRAAFTRAWLALLPRLSATDRALSLRALNVLHCSVVPHLTQPLIVMDWVGSCIDQGGVVGVLSLHTLLLLIRRYNLDYPSFYTRMYTFLDRDVLHLKHRAQFLRVLEMSLDSTHLPATLIASFVKKISRLSLNASPAAIVTVIPFVYNILKRHPRLMRMIHCDEESIGMQNDPFLEEECNPNVTFALDSSLWELLSLKCHYHSAISTLACIFEQAFTKPGYLLEDFLDHTYATMTDAEMACPIYKDPAISDRQMGTVHLKQDAAVVGDIIWTCWAPTV